MLIFSLRGSEIMTMSQNQRQKEQEKRRQRNQIQNQINNQRRNLNNAHQQMNVVNREIADLENLEHGVIEFLDRFTAINDARGHRVSMYFPGDSNLRLCQQYSNNMHSLLSSQQYWGSRSGIEQCLQIVRAKLHEFYSQRNSINNQISSINNSINQLNNRLRRIR